jgi:LysR family transcriptional activator of glutamate synthase operon
VKITIGTERIEQSMTLHQLKIWTTVARRQSMTKAANELRIRQPSVTQQIKLLEREYRLKLYDVNGRGIELTQVGKLFLKNAKKILLQVQNLEKAIKGLKRSRRHK